MNAARVAQLHRELARIHGELAEELSDEPTPVQAVPEVPRRPRTRAFHAPLGEVSDTDRARAAKMLRRRGIGA